MEWFDVVDRNDQVVEVRTREDVHREQLLHRAVHIFVQRPDGRLLIHLRSAAKEEFPSVWTSSASGHVSSGEDYAAAAERELFEELGLRSVLQRFGKFAACPDTSYEFTELFLTTTSDSVQFDPVEIDQIRWISLDEVQRKLTTQPEKFSPAFRLLFDAWRNDNQT